MKAQLRASAAGLGVLLTLASPLARAAEVNFDALAADTVVTSQFPGATFSSIAGQEIRVV